MAGYGVAKYNVNKYNESTSSASYTFNPIAAQSVSSFDVTTVTASLTSGSSTPDSYVWALVPNGDVHSLVLSPSGPSVSFVAPGRFNGCTVVLRVDAISAGAVSASTTATITVGKHADYIYVNGRWVALARPRVLHAPAFA